MAEACGLTSCPSGIVLKSTLLHNPEVQYSLVPKLSHHKWKNIGFSSLKNISTMRSCFSVERKRNGVFPLMMFLVAKQRVMMTGLVRELAHRHRAMTSAFKRIALRHQQRGLKGFCLIYQQLVL